MPFPGEKDILKVNRRRGKEPKISLHKIEKLGLGNNYTQRQQGIGVNIWRLLSR